MELLRPQRAIAAAVALLAAVALSAAPSARADAGHTIVLRCTHGESLSGFPPSAYAKALKDLSATTEEYSDCAQLIRQAQLAASASHGSPSGGPAGSVAQAVAATPAEQRALQSAATGGSEPVNLGGQLVKPGVVHANIASALSTLPTPIVALLAFLVLCLLAWGGGTLRKRIRGGRVAD